MALSEDMVTVRGDAEKVPMKGAQLVTDNVACLYRM